MGLAFLLQPQRSHPRNLLTRWSVDELICRRGSGLTGVKEK